MQYNVQMQNAHTLSTICTYSWMAISCSFNCCDFFTDSESMTLNKASFLFLICGINMLSNRCSMILIAPSWLRVNGSCCCSISEINLLTSSSRSCSDERALCSAGDTITCWVEYGLCDEVDGGAVLLCNDSMFKLLAALKRVSWMVVSSDRSAANDLRKLNFVCVHEYVGETEYRTLDHHLQILQFHTTLRVWLLYRQMLWLAAPDCCP